MGWCPDYLLVLSWIILIVNYIFVVVSTYGLIAFGTIPALLLIICLIVIASKYSRGDKPRRRQAPTHYWYGVYITIIAEPDKAIIFPAISIRVEERILSRFSLIIIDNFASLRIVCHSRRPQTCTADSCISKSFIDASLHQCTTYWKHWLVRKC